MGQWKNFKNEKGEVQFKKIGNKDLTNAQDANENAKKKSVKCLDGFILTILGITVLLTGYCFGNLVGGIGGQAVAIQTKLIAISLGIIGAVEFFRYPDPVQGPAKWVKMTICGIGIGFTIYNIVSLIGYDIPKLQKMIDEQN